jgi:hypothetical protein
MSRKPYVYLVFAPSLLWFALAIAQPIMRYCRAPGRWLDLASRIDRYDFYLLLAIGAISYLLLFTPKFRNRRKAFEEAIERNRLSPWAKFVSAAVFTLAAAGLIALIVFLGPDKRTEDLLTGLLPFLVVAVSLGWAYHRVRTNSARNSNHS